MNESKKLRRLVLVFEHKTFSNIFADNPVLWYCSIYILPPVEYKLFTLRQWTYMNMFMNLHGYVYLRTQDLYEHQTVIIYICVCIFENRRGIFYQAKCLSLFYSSALRAGWVLSSRSGRLGGWLPDLRNPYLIGWTCFIHHFWQSTCKW